MKKFSEELHKLSNSIVIEKKNREEAEQNIYETLREVVTKVKTEIDAEKKSREGSEEQLLSLLEETCNKINNAYMI